ncbi:hypothetical protein ACFX2C_020980 [Malus domestica]
MTAFTALSAIFIFRTILLPLLSPILSLFSPSTSDELQHLLNFKQSLEPSNPSLFTTWAPPNWVCNFTGIVCDSDGFVSEIILSQHNLSRFLPLHAICSLPSLKRLSLGSKGLYGSLADDLKNCSSLEQLDLGKNSFSGTSRLIFFDKINLPESQWQWIFREIFMEIAVILL